MEFDDDREDFWSEEEGASPSEGNGAPLPERGWDTSSRFDGWLAGDGEGDFPVHYQEAIERFVRGHPLWPVLEGRLGYELQDLVQEVNLVFLRDAPQRFRYRGKGSLEGWLKVVTQRRLIDLFRRDTGEKRGGGCGELPLDPEHDEHVVRMPGRSREATPSSGLRSEELLERAAQRLTAEEFHVWYESDVAEPPASSVELARHLGRSDSAVRSILYRARAKLMDLFSR